MSIIAHTGESAKVYFDRIRMERQAKLNPDEEPEEPFTVLETGIPLGVLPSTPKRILRKAREAGFTVEGYEARVAYADSFFKTGDRRGELKKEAFEQRNTFIGGHVLEYRVRFYATWLGSKFSAHIYDPIGQYRYANSRQADERETYWMDSSSRSFEKWIADWDSILQHATHETKEAA